LKRAFTFLLLTLLFAVLRPADVGAIVVLQYQPGDASRPWTWRPIIEHLAMVKAAGYTTILISPRRGGRLMSIGRGPDELMLCIMCKPMHTLPSRE
jgi:hypothetical protein